MLLHVVQPVRETILATVACELLASTFCRIRADDGSIDDRVRTAFAHYFRRNALRDFAYDTAITATEECPARVALYVDESRRDHHSGRIDALSCRCIAQQPARRYARNAI